MQIDERQIVRRFNAARTPQQLADLLRNPAPEEERALRVKGITPKSVFQIGGSGSVGTASLRGMKTLRPPMTKVANRSIRVATWNSGPTFR